MAKKWDFLNNCNERSLAVQEANLITRQIETFLLYAVWSDVNIKSRPIFQMSPKKYLKQFFLEMQKFVKIAQIVRKYLGCFCEKIGRHEL